VASVTPKACHTMCGRLEEKMEKLTITVATAMEGMKWIKLAVLGIYSLLGVAIGKEVVAGILHR
jgi:hypothetical protein